MRVSSPPPPCPPPVHKPWDGDGTRGHDVEVHSWEHGWLIDNPLLSTA